MTRSIPRSRGLYYEVSDTSRGANEVSGTSSGHLVGHRDGSSVRSGRPGTGPYRDVRHPCVGPSGSGDEVSGTSALNLGSALLGHFGSDGAEPPERPMTKVHYEVSDTSPGRHRHGHCPRPSRIPPTSPEAPAGARRAPSRARSRSRARRAQSACRARMRHRDPDQPSRVGACRMPETRRIPEACDRGRTEAARGTSRYALARHAPAPSDQPVEVKAPRAESP